MPRTNQKVWNLAFDMFKWDLAEDGAYDQVDAEEGWYELPEETKNQYYDDAEVALRQEGKLN